MAKKRTKKAAKKSKKNGIAALMGEMFQAAVAQAQADDIKLKVDAALELLEQTYPEQLRGLLPKVFARSNMRFAPQSGPPPCSPGLCRTTFGVRSPAPSCESCHASRTVISWLTAPGVSSPTHASLGGSPPSSCLAW